MNCAHLRWLLVLGLLGAQLGTAAANEQTADVPAPDKAIAPAPIARTPSKVANAAPPPASTEPAAPTPLSETTTTDTPPAAVETPIDTRWRLDGMLGLGSDQLNLGLGARVGKTFDNHLYVGGLFVYHVGDTVSTTTGSASAHGIYVGPDVGYEISLEHVLPVIIRPYIGLGMATAWGSSTVNGMSTSASSSELAIWPGLAAYHRFADTSYALGGDLRIVTGPWGTSVGLFVVGGMYFGS